MVIQYWMSSSSLENSLWFRVFKLHMVVHTREIDFWPKCHYYSYPCDIGAIDNEIIWFQNFDFRIGCNFDTDFNESWCEFVLSRSTFIFRSIAYLIAHTNHWFPELSYQKSHPSVWGITSCYRRHVSWLFIQMSWIWLVSSTTW